MINWNISRETLIVLGQIGIRAIIVGRNTLVGLTFLPIKRVLNLIREAETTDKKKNLTLRARNYRRCTGHRGNFTIR